MILDGYAEIARDGWASFQSFVGFWAPTIPVPRALHPLAVIGSLIALIATTGMALGSLALFVTAVLVLYLLLRELFGVEVRVLNYEL
jgi:hypothetical protein